MYVVILYVQLLTSVVFVASIPVIQVLFTLFLILHALLGGTVVEAKGDEMTRYVTGCAN